MTSKEAIEHLRELKALKIEFPNTLQEQALDLAIKALEERPQGDLISREALKEHKFVGNKFVQIGGRNNGKTLESINKAYQQGWNDCIDAIIDNAPAVNKIDEYVEAFKKAMAEIDDKKPQDEWKEYKPLELDYNVQCAVENLKTAYWSNEPEKDAKNFTEAEDIIISAICHHGYTVYKQPQDEWIKHITYFECSNCKHCYDYDYAEDIDPVTDLNFSFCPNCGADMRGEKK